MTRLATVAVLLILLTAGCKRSSSLQPAGKAGDSVAIRADPALKSFAGRWGQDGEVLVTVELRSDGSGLLKVRHLDEAWRAEVRNAHVENGNLVYDQVNYSDEQPNQPLHGVRCRMSLEPVAGSSNQLRQRLSTANLTSEPVILERIP